MALLVVALVVLGAGLVAALVSGAALRRRIAVISREHAAAEAAAALAEGSWRRLARVLQSIPEGVVVCDQDGVEVYRNPGAAAFAGARHGEALVEQAIHEQLQAAIDGYPERRELEVFGPPRRILVIAAGPLEDADAAIGAVAVVEDVSERRRLEAVRRDFVSNISHELKTPVGALGLLAETLTVETDPEVSRRLAERMTTEAFRVAQVIDDLLDLSRIEAEEQPVQETLAVRHVVAEAADRSRPLADARQITVQAAAVPLRHTVRGDRRQLVSALHNLLENACKYSDEGSMVEVASRSTAGVVEIEVRDHGIGIPARDLERVFERFYRVDRARSRDTGGTGLGLAIVRHVMSNHGGEVRVTSREGEGSVFTLRLPIGPGGIEPVDQGVDFEEAMRQ